MSFKHCRTENSTKFVYTQVFVPNEMTSCCQEKTLKKCFIPSLMKIILCGIRTGRKQKEDQSTLWQNPILVQKNQVLNKPIFGGKIQIQMLEQISSKFSSGQKLRFCISVQSSSTSLKGMLLFLVAAAQVREAFLWKRGQKQRGDFVQSLFIRKPAGLRRSSAFLYWYSRLATLH